MPAEEICLKKREAFAVGNNRACYVHEAFPGRCLKILRPDLPQDSKKGANRAGGDDNEEEHRLLTTLHRRLDPEARRIFPECDGFVETDLGPALVTELCTDHDGKISLTLDHIIRDGVMSDAIAEALEKFKKAWIKAGLRSRQFRLHNLIVQEGQVGNYRIRVIDGLGQKGGVFPKPFHLLFRWKARKKIKVLEKRIVRFGKMTPEEQASRMRGIRQDDRGVG